MQRLKNCMFLNNMKPNAKWIRSLMYSPESWKAPGVTKRDKVGKKQSKYTHLQRKMRMHSYTHIYKHTYSQFNTVTEDRKRDQEEENQWRKKM